MELTHQDVTVDIDSRRTTVAMRNARTGADAFLQGDDADAWITEFYVVTDDPRSDGTLAEIAAFLADPYLHEECNRD